MSVRTADDVYDKLAADLIWRKKEVSTFKWLLSQATRDRRNPLLRGGLTLVYAHWEGFVKNAGGTYLEFLHHRRLKSSELAPHFVAVAARSLLRKAAGSSKISAHLEVTNFFLKELHNNSRLPYRDVVDTGSNLSSDLLREIVQTLGLDFSPFETKTMLIDERLLKARNSIAHGEYVSIDEEAFEDLAEDVVGMLDAFRTQIENAVALGSYRANPIPA